MPAVDYGQSELKNNFLIFIGFLPVLLFLIGFCCGYLYNRSDKSNEPITLKFSPPSSEKSPLIQNYV